VSLVALTVFYYNAASIIRSISGIDVFDPKEQAHRKKEVLEFIRHAPFTNPEAVVQ
jgi:hypothetical protein